MRNSEFTSPSPDVKTSPLCEAKDTRCGIRYPRRQAPRPAVASSSEKPKYIHDHDRLSGLVAKELTGSVSKAMVSLLSAVIKRAGRAAYLGQALILDNEMLQDWAGVSRRQAQRLYQELVSREVLEPQAGETGGRGSVREVLLNFDALSDFIESSKRRGAIWGRTARMIIAAGIAQARRLFGSESEPEKGDIKGDILDPLYKEDNTGTVAERPLSDLLLGLAQAFPSRRARQRASLTANFPPLNLHFLVQDGSALPEGGSQ